MARLDHERLMNLLAEAVELPGPRRGPFLDSTCSGEPELRRELEELLACAEPASATFESASQHLVQPDPQQIGPYEILEPIGEGGMAIVYKAQQHSPVRRVVALKLIKLGMDTRQFVARFESERQTLAMMDHPNIARVFDAGSTETGRPYFVMEYVPGESLLRYCDEQNLGLRQRLELFRVVCDAVEHAHRKGIIHRDLKDSNVLVSAIDGKPLPKVIDFGVAKVIKQSAAGQQTLQTEHGQLIGTPEYMSPEQAERGELDIDTRTDVYSLGVLLYELIAGVPPIPSEVLRSAGYEQVQRIIRETSTPRPSTRLGTLGGADAARIAKRRQVELPTLIRDLRSELEWIPLKAMRKDREQRYRSAAELADDITNYLETRPLLAGPESGLYRSRKYVRRHKLGVAASAAMVLLLIGGIIATSWEAIRATRAEARAAQERDNAQATLDFLTDDVLANATPERIPDVKVRDEIVKAMIDPASKRVGEAFHDRPLIEASLRETIRSVLVKLGRSDLAQPHAEAALSIRRSILGPDHPDTISSLNNYASVLEKRGHSAEAEAFYKEALDRRHRLLGDDDPRTLLSLNNYAHILTTESRFAEAEPLLKQSLERRRRVSGENDLETIRAVNNYGFVLESLDRVTEAEPLYKQALDQWRRILGPDHPQTLYALNNYAAVLEHEGRATEAEPIFKEALERRQRVLGPDHPDTIWSLGEYANVLYTLGRNDEAEPLFNEVLLLTRRVLGEDHPRTLRAMWDYAAVLQALGRVSEAEPLARQAMQRFAVVLGEGHATTIGMRAGYAKMLLSLGRAAEAEPLARDSVAKATTNPSLGPKHYRTKQFASTYVASLDALGRHEEADAVRRQFDLPQPTTQKEK